MPADQRRQQLFEVARERFAQQGFHATSMDEIAEAAGVTKPVLYQHFPSKRALYVELLSLRSDPEFARIVEEILDAAAETIATLIEIPAPDEQRQMLANAIVGMAESVGLHVLRDPGRVVDSDQLAQWISEFAWFGLRGVRTDTAID